MVNIVWNTPSGPLASFVIGQSSTVAVSATDTASGRNLIYVLSRGTLPPGLTLNSNGVISGVPSYQYATSNYFSIQGYTFTIRAMDPQSGLFVDSEFNIEVTNYTNTDIFTWATPGGSLGTVPDGNFYSHEVEAIDRSGLAVRYSINTGAMPPGLQLVSGKSYAINTIALSTGKVVVKTVDKVSFFTGQIVKFKSVVGTTELNGQKFYIKMLDNNGLSNVLNVAPGSSTYLQLYLDSGFTNPADGSTLTQYISGGIVYTNGYLQGTPTITDTTAIKDETFRFTVRATNSANHVVDQSFTLTVTNNVEPIISPHGATPGIGELVKPFFLGSVLDGTYYQEQLTISELNPNVSVVWELDAGSLPPGITLSTDGLLSGYVQPVQLVGEYGPAGFDGDTTYKTPSGFDTGIITAEQEYDLGPYDFNNLNQTEGYSFTVRAYDGANYVKQDYTIQIVAKDDYRADSTLPINNSYLTVDANAIYVPVIKNTSKVLPAGRQDSYYAFKFDGYDFQGDELTYYLANTVGTFDAYVSGADAGFDYGGTGVGGGDEGGAGFSLTTTGRSGTGFDSYSLSSGVSNLPGLFLDSQTGWIYGKLNAQTSAYENYTFGVYVTKTRNGQTYNSNTTFFTLPVFGDINNTINWETPADLGAVDNGSISELSVVAKSTLGKELIYSVYDVRGTKYSLPQGLELLSTGEISGRVSFEVFDLDDFATTFDGDKLTVDRTYKFTVQAASVDGTVNSIKEFTLRVNVINKNPYKNLYLRAMPTFDQRQIYNSVVNDTTIFNPDLIYRPDDPWFGVNKNLEMLFLPGLRSADMDAFEAAMQKNHYTKSYTFGDVKTAVVLDNLYNVKYEVVYVEVVDTEENTSNRGPGLEIDLAVANPYIDANGGTHSILYPNTTTDMITRLTGNIGYEDQNSLPEWMTSNQPDPTSAKKFKTPLGFTKAVVMAYTKPGYSNLLAYRLKNSGINFNRIQFTADRYIVDDYYSTNFNGTTGTYSTQAEATFDALPNRNVGNISFTVDYGVNVPFNEINGRPLEYVMANGGIDGLLPHSGQSLIFVKQENFNNSTYDGWVNYSDLYLGDNLNSVTVEGYDSEGYDRYSLIPGFLEHAQNSNIVNQRGGIWQINIVNGIVTLTFVQPVQLNQRIRILGGKTYTSAIVFYSLNLAPGQSVPYYQVYRYEKYTKATPTTFNGGGTRFFSYRDTYYAPGTQDKYLKFPQYGVFN